MTEKEKQARIKELKIEKWNVIEHLKMFGKLIFDEEIHNELLDKLSEINKEIDELERE